jgi:hypothetical protein
MAISASNFRANSLSGTVSVVNGYANISLATIPYALEGNKSFVIKLRTGSPTGPVLATSPTITLQDTSSIVSLTSNVSSVSEGSAVSFTLTTSNVIDGSNVYYSTNSTTTNSADFISANTGLLTIINNTATFTLTANADNITEGTEIFGINIRTNNAAGNVVYTSNNINILDTSNALILASGGNNVFINSGYKYHVFLSSNNFVISNPANPASVEVFLVGGGGGAGSMLMSPSDYVPGTGGGGAGGFLISNTNLSGTVSVIVGAGGISGGPVAGSNGSNSSVSSVVAYGGGGGGRNLNGKAGGSGGGGSGGGGTFGAAIGSPGTIGVAGPQGYPGNNGLVQPTRVYGAGGGGAGSLDNGPPPGAINQTWGGKGAALSWSIPTSYGTPGPTPGVQYFAGGGGGGGYFAGAGGYGGGGGGQTDADPGFGGNATVNTGGGGGGGNFGTPGPGGGLPGTGGSGGSGIVIIRYPA